MFVNLNWFISAFSNKNICLIYIALPPILSQFPIRNQEKKVQVGKDKEKIPTPKTEMGKN